jgi:hypothetical protein
VHIAVEWLGGSWAGRGSSRLDGFALPASTPLLDALGYGPKSLRRCLPFLYFALAYFALAADADGGADLASFAFATGFVIRRTSRGSASARVRQAKWPIGTRVPPEREALLHVVGLSRGLLRSRGQAPAFESAQDSNVRTDHDRVKLVPSQSVSCSPSGCPG